MFEVNTCFLFDPVRVCAWCVRQLPSLDSPTVTLTSEPSQLLWMTFVLQALDREDTKPPRDCVPCIALTGTPAQQADFKMFFSAE